MDFKKTWLAGVATALAVSAGTVLLSQGSAVAATCSPRPESSCVGVTNRTSHVKSIRVNGRCLIGASGTYSSVQVTRLETPDVQTYGGSNCESNTHNSATVRWGTEGADRFRWVRIS